MVESSCQVCCSGWCALGVLGGDEMGERWGMVLGRGWREGVGCPADASQQWKSRIGEKILCHFLKKILIVIPNRPPARNVELS